MKLSEYSEAQIKEMLDKRSAYLESIFAWKYKDRRYRALMNEWEKRVVAHRQWEWTFV